MRNSFSIFHIIVLSNNILTNGQRISNMKILQYDALAVLTIAREWFTLYTICSFFYLFSVHARISVSVSRDIR